jgi:hypothetical protein
VPKLTIVCLSAVLLCGCASITPAELAAWQETSATLTEEIRTYHEELAADPTIEEKERILAALAWAQPRLEQANAVIQDAQTGGDVGWGLLEVGVGVLIGFFPVLGALGPLVRSARRVSRSLIASVQAGGGPANPEVARKALDVDPAARKFYDANKVA